MSVWAFTRLLVFVVVFNIGPARAHDPNAIPDMVESVQDGVVSISARMPVKVEEVGKAPPLPNVPENSPFKEFFKEFADKKNGSKRTSPTLGSGFVVDPSGLILTNYHVVKQAEEITVTLRDGTAYKVAKVVGSDERTDIAVLKISSSKKLTALKLGDSSKVRLGEQVIAIGNPFGFANSISSGIVSGLNRDVASGPYDAFIQTDAAQNRGHAGGPLLNLNGVVIGMSTKIFSPSGGSVGIGFAIPSNTIVSVKDALIKFGNVRRGWLGVRIQSVTDDIATGLGMEKAHGTLVASVNTGSPAEAAGIKGGDVIIEFNGLKIAVMSELPKAVASTPPEKRATVVVLRKGKRKTLSVVLGLLPKTADNMKASRPGEIAGAFKALGMTFNDLTPALRKTFSVGSKVKRGVLISEVAEGSVGATKRIIAGNVVMEIGQQTVASVRDAAKFLQALKKEGRESALMLVSNTSGDLRFIAVPLAGMEIVSVDKASRVAPVANEKPLKELEKLE